MGVNEYTKQSQELEVHGFSRVAHALKNVFLMSIVFQKIWILHW